MTATDLYLHALGTTITTTNPDTIHHTLTQHGTCTTIGGDHWYPEQGHDPTKEPSPNAYTICNQCPVQHLCLAYALTTKDQHGIWGGHTPKRRRTITRQLRKLGYHW